MSIDGISKFVRESDPSGAEAVLFPVGAVPLAKEPVSFIDACAKAVEPAVINATTAGIIVKTDSIANTFFENFNLPAKV
jgi:hypothetical protein